MRLHLIIFIILFAKVSSFGQNDSLLTTHKLFTINQSILNFTTDNLGNIYIITASNQIKKLNAKGDSLAVYNDVKRYSNIYSIDASNPLKILVYYKDFATIVILDRQLNVRNTIDLRKQNIYQVRTVATSYDGNFWLYDEVAGKIKKIDDFGKVVMESTDLRMALPTPPQPNAMYDRDGQLYLYDSTIGLFVFDYYGALKNTYSLTNVSDLQVIDKNTITGREGSVIILYKPLTLQLNKYQINIKTDDFSQVRFYGTRLFALTSNKKLEIFSIP